MFPALSRFTDLGILLLRLMVGLVFVTSGYSHLKDPEGRSKSIGMSKGFTVFLGMAEVAGGLGVAAGVLPQIAAFGLILIMLARRDSEENVCVAHRVLGREVIGVALRSDICADESADCVHRWGQVRAGEVIRARQLSDNKSLLPARLGDVNSSLVHVGSLNLC